MEDYTKMKVADLKKLLKGQGLSVAGNKNELIERLQMNKSENNGHIASASVGDDEDFDEEAILGDEEDTDLTLPHEEESALLGTNQVSVEPSKKKITLKRSEPCLSSALEPEEEAAPEETQPSEETEEPKPKKIKISTDEPVSEESKNLEKSDIVKSTAQMSIDEKRKLRAARFGDLPPSNPKKIVDNVVTDVEVLKKRAERFGEVTSKTLTKAAETDKMKQRKDRFTDSTTANGSVTTADVSTDAKKTARAERFAA